MIPKMKNVRLSMRFLMVGLSIAILTTSLSYYLLDQKNMSCAHIVNMSLVDSLPTIKLSLQTKGCQMPVMRGVELNPKNLMNMTFYFDTMDKTTISRADIDRFIKYFLGFLAIPKEDVWVNLSPYEKERVVPEELGKLNAGKDLLLEDYLLKQLTCKVTDPRNAIGKNFWKKVRQICYVKNKTTNIPIDTFNKVWIVPQKAIVAVHNNKFFVKEAQLKIMLEEDYLAQRNHNLNKSSEIRKNISSLTDSVRETAKEVFRKELLPIIENQVNNSANFAPLRQIFYCLILADFIKNIIKTNPSYAQYIDGKRAEPLALNNAAEVKKFIYDSYVKSFREGAYDYVHKEYDPYLNKTITRKYCSGGAEFAELTTEPGEINKGLFVNPKVVEVPATLTPEKNANGQKSKSPQNNSVHIKHFQDLEKQHAAETVMEEEGISYLELKTRVRYNSPVDADATEAFESFKEARTELLKKKAGSIQAQMMANITKVLKGSEEANEASEILQNILSQAIAEFSDVNHVYFFPAQVFGKEDYLLGEQRIVNGQRRTYYAFQPLKKFKRSLQAIEYILHEELEQLVKELINNEMFLTIFFAAFKTAYGPRAYEAYYQRFVKATDEDKAHQLTRAIQAVLFNYPIEENGDLINNLGNGLRQEINHLLPTNSLLTKIIKPVIALLLTIAVPATEPSCRRWNHTQIVWDTTPESTAPQKMPVPQTTFNKDTLTREDVLLIGKMLVSFYNENKDKQPIVIGKLDYDVLDLTFSDGARCLYADSYEKFFEIAPQTQFIIRDENTLQVDRIVNGELHRYILYINDSTSYRPDLRAAEERNKNNLFPSIENRLDSNNMTFRDAAKIAYILREYAYDRRQSGTIRIRKKSGAFNFYLPHFGTVLRISYEKNTFEVPKNVYFNVIDSPLDFPRVQIRATDKPFVEERAGIASIEKIIKSDFENLGMVQKKEEGIILDNDAPLTPEQKEWQKEFRRDWQDEWEKACREEWEEKWPGEWPKEWPEEWQEKWQKEPASHIQHFKDPNKQIKAELAMVKEGISYADAEARAKLNDPKDTDLIEAFNAFKSARQALINQKEKTLFNQMISAIDKLTGTSPDTAHVAKKLKTALQRAIFRFQNTEHIYFFPAQVFGKEDYLLGEQCIINNELRTYYAIQPLKKVSGTLQATETVTHEALEWEVNTLVNDVAFVEAFFALFRQVYGEKCYKAYYQRFSQALAEEKGHQLTRAIQVILFNYPKTVDGDVINLLGDQLREYIDNPGGVNLSFDKSIVTIQGRLNKNFYLQANANKLGKVTIPINGITYRIGPVERKHVTTIICK